MINIYLRFVLLLIIGVAMTSAQAMKRTLEQDNKDICFLPYIPLDLQRAIICPSSIHAKNITEANADALNEEIKNFLALSQTCEYFNKKFVFPLFALDNATKNKMMADINLLMREVSYPQYCEHSFDSILFGRFPEEVSFGYKKYRAILLALVCSAAGSDMIRENSTTSLFKAVYAKDALGVALLLAHKADLQQTGFGENFLAAHRTKGAIIEYGGILGGEIFLHSPTQAILTLFLEHVSEQKLISLREKLPLIMRELIKLHYDLDVFRFWLNRAVEAECDWRMEGISILRHIINDISFWVQGDTDRDNVLQKMRCLLKVLPLNIINNTYSIIALRTPIDHIELLVAITRRPKKFDNADQLIALLREHGGKKAEELEMEGI